MRVYEYKTIRILDKLEAKHAIVPSEVRVSGYETCEAEIFDLAISSPIM